MGSLEINYQPIKFYTRQEMLRKPNKNATARFRTLLNSNHNPAKPSYNSDNPVKPSKSQYNSLKTYTTKYPESSQCKPEQCSQEQSIHREKCQQDAGKTQ